MRQRGGASPIPFDELPEPLRSTLRPRVERLGYLGGFFQHAAHQPEALLHFIHWTETLKAALPFRIAEVLALTIAAETDNEYERVQHERLALANGFTVEEVTSLVTGRAASCASLSATEVASATLASCVVATHGRGCQAALVRLARLVDEPTAVACLMLTSRYVAHSVMSNAWDLPAPVPSPLEEDR